MTEAPYDPESPLLLLGRGGGGTRLLSDLARTCGVYLGDRVSVSGDSQDWIEPLYTLALEQISQGLPVRADDPAWIGRLRSHSMKVLSGAPRAGAVGWGWKLPETILALSPVLQAFGSPRVVHMVRHPLTMALRRSHLTSRMDNVIGQAVLPAAYRRIGRDPDQIGEDPVWLHNAASWTYQIGHVLDCRKAARPLPWLQIGYEDICTDAFGVASRLSAFIEAPHPGQVRIDPDRVASTIVFDAVSEAVWTICGPVAERLGYVYDEPFRAPGPQA